MKKQVILGLSVIMLGFTACNDDVMDKINADTLHPTSEVVSAYLQMSEAIMNTAFSTVSGDYAFYTSSLTEQLVGSGNNQLMKAELRQSVELAASATFNNSWSSTYANLANIQEVINKVENELAGSGGQLDVLGAAKVLKVINFGILTDLHGDIPYTEALQGSENLQPKLDSQQEIYADLINIIDDAISDLSQASGMNNMGDQDLAFGNDVSQWLATAYAVKARYLLHQSAVNSSAVAQAKEAAKKAVELGFSGMTVSLFNGVNCDNPWSAFIWSRGYTAPSTHVAELMAANDDPRYVYYNGDNAATPGDEAAAKESWWYDYPYYYDLGSQPVHIFSVSELYFILAETQLRTGEDATEAFQTAVAASVDEIAGWFDEDGGGAEFAESLGTPTLQTLFDQKYIAMCVDEQVETYNDIRRLKAMGEDYITLTNPKNTQSGINRWPELLPYGNGSVTTNPNIAAAYGDGSYVYSTKSWINGGN